MGQDWRQASKMTHDALHRAHMLRQQWQGRLQAPTGCRTAARAGHAPAMVHANSRTSKAVSVWLHIATGSMPGSYSRTSRLASPGIAAPLPQVIVLALETAPR